MPETMSLERRSWLKTLDAEIVLKQGFEGMGETINDAGEVLKKEKSSD